MSQLNDTGELTGLAARRAAALQHAAAGQAHTAAKAARAAAGRSRRPKAELQEILEAGLKELTATNGAEASTSQVCAWAAEQFNDLLTVACSMADTVLPHVVAQHAPWVDVLFLETGYHFAETIGTRDAAEVTLPITIVDVLPKQTVAEQDAQYGANLFERDPALCCQMRKVEPLTRTLPSYEAWVTGVRREEGPTRANTPLLTWDAGFGLVKINPLAAWSYDELLEYSNAFNLPVNPLLAEGYPSIGCAPCTAKPAPGEDPRSGRWAGLNKTECGLHS